MTEKYVVQTVWKVWGNRKYGVCVLLLFCGEGERELIQLKTERH